MLVDRVLADLDLPQPSDQGGNPLRGSRLGRCARQSAYMLFPEAYPPEPLPARTRLVFAFGDMIHEMLRAQFRRVVPGQWGMEEERFHFRVPVTIKEAKAALRLFETGALVGYVHAGSTVTLYKGPRERIASRIVGRQTQKYGLWLDTAAPALYVPLHVDGIADIGGPLASCEIKSMTTAGFRFALAGKVGYEYRVQMATAIDATELDAALYIAVNKNTSHVLEVLYSKRAEKVSITFTKQSQMVKSIEQPASDATPMDDWEAARVDHPFEPRLLDEARARVKKILLATPTRLPEREYGVDFTCPTCDGTGTQTNAKQTGLPLKRGAKPCEDCEKSDVEVVSDAPGDHGTITTVGAPSGKLAEAELAWQCRYALPPEARILLPDLTWKAAGKIIAGDRVFGFDEEPQGRYRRTRVAEVTDAREVHGDTLILTTERGVIRCSPEHPWLVKDPGPEGGVVYRRGVEWQNRAHWREAGKIRPGMGVAMLTTTETLDHESDDYLAGYVRGLVEGDGTTQERGEGTYVRVAMTDGEALDRLAWALHAFGIPSKRGAFNPGTTGYPGRKPIERVLFGGASGAPATARLLAWPIETREAAAGYLGGIFDAEGSAEGIASPRISQATDSPMWARVLRAGALLGCDLRVEPANYRNMSTARLYAEPLLPALLRFYALTRPAITRKVKVLDRPIRNLWVSVLAVEPGPAERLITLSTSTKTFVADGYASHNCPMLLHCWGEVKPRLAFDKEAKPHYWIERRAFEASGIRIEGPKG